MESQLLNKTTKKRKYMPKSKKEKYMPKFDSADILKSVHDALETCYGDKLYIDYDGIEALLISDINGKMCTKVIIKQL